MTIFFLPKIYYFKISIWLLVDLCRFLSTDMMVTRERFKLPPLFFYHGPPKIGCLADGLENGQPSADLQTAVQKHRGRLHGSTRLQYRASL
jgi:hypothetical protein